MQFGKSLMYLYDIITNICYFLIAEQSVYIVLQHIQKKRKPNIFEISYFVCHLCFFERIWEKISYLKCKLFIFTGSYNSTCLLSLIVALYSLYSLSPSKRHGNQTIIRKRQLITTNLAPVSKIFVLICL